MTKERYLEIARELEKMREFLYECDEGLEWEVAAKDDIGKRIFQAEKGMANLKKLAMNAAK